jgi:manganese efflux pump family protein
MSFASVVLIAVGLAMDAFSVSVCSGMCFREMRSGGALRMAGSFGVFQAGMPAVGWVGGTLLAEWIAPFDHWIAFGLLAAIGGKMIGDGLRRSPNDCLRNPLQLGVLLILSVATSIDSLAVGVSLAVLDTAIVSSIAVIGIVTFGLSLAGVSIGKCCGDIFRGRIEIAGGLILIGIGLRILLSHLMTAPGLAG